MSPLARLHALSAFLPRALPRALAEDASRPRAGGRTEQPAAVLFADLTGFTPLAEALGRQGPRGAERLAQILDGCFSELIESILDHGGDVLRFAGDALLAMWPAESPEALPGAVQLAAQCAQQAQVLMGRRDAVEGARLRLRMGLSAGPVQLSDVGGDNGRWEFLATGQPLLEMARAEHAAKPGEVVLAESAWRLLGGGKEGQPVQEGVWRLTRLDPVPLPLVQAPSPLPRMEPVLRAYIPEVVLRRLDAGHSQWLSEFRNLTVMFINLGDASFAAGQQAEQVQRAFQLIQSSLNRYEGGVSQLVVDDKGVVTVAAFGLPYLSHEDDALRALRAAREIHAGLAAQGVRHSIGVTSGRVFCGVYGHLTRLEYAMVGPVVNLAARLMQAAQNEVLCDTDTMRLASHRLRFEPLPPLRAKGVAEPVAVFRPTEEVHGRPAGQLRLVGREVERARVRAMVEALAQRGEDGTLLVEGEAGIGKSHLMQYVQEVATAAGLATAQGSGTAQEQSTAHHVWRMLLPSLLGLDVLPDASARTARLLSLIELHPEQREWAPLLKDVLPVELPETEVTQQMTGTVRAISLRELLVLLLQDAARTRPLVLVLDDVHWMDSSSWKLALTVRRQVRGLLLVVSGRPMGEQAPPEYLELKEAPGTEPLSLERMSPAEVLTLVCERLGARSLPPAVATLIQEKAEGHPFFSVEIARALLDAGHLQVVEGEGRLTVPESVLRALNLPGTVEGLLNSRLDRLATSQQLTLKVASVIARVFSYRVLEGIHPVAADRGTVREDLEGLTQHGLTLLERPEPQLEYAFKHVLIQEAAYNLMLSAQRQQLHRAVAHFYEQHADEKDELFYPRLAYHWRLAGAPAKALDYLERAGDAALAKGATREAITFFSEAQQLARSAPDAVRVDTLRRARWSVRLGEAHHVRGEVARSREHLDEALGLLARPLPTTRASWVLRMGKEVSRQVAHLLVLRWLPEPAAEVRSVRALVSHTEYIVSEQLYFGLDLLGFLTAGLASINDAEAARDLVPAGRAYGAFGYTAGMVGLEGLALRYLRLARVNPLLASWCDGVEGAFHVLYARWDKSLAMSERGIALARRINDRTSQLIGYEGLAFMRDMLGDPAAACRMREEELKVAREDANAEYTMLALCNLAAHLLELDRPEEARERLSESEALLPRLRGNFALNYRGAMALVCVRRGEPDRARAEVDQMLALLRQKPALTAQSLMPLTVLAYACLELWEHARRTGEPERPERQRAQEACQVMWRCAQLLKISRARALRLEGTWCWLAGKPARAARLWRKALDFARSRQIQYDEGLTLYELGRTAEDPSTRDRLLREAREALSSVHCTHHLRAIDSLLGSPQAEPMRRVAP